MKIAKGIVALMAGSVALVGCAKPAAQANPPANETAKPGKVGAPTDNCAGSAAAETFLMKVNPDFHVIRTGPNVKPNKPNPNPGQLDTLTALADGQSAKITIQLTGKLAFAGGASAFQVKPTGTLIFCGLTAPDGQTLTFYTYRQAGLATSSAYSLAMLVPDPSPGPNNGNPTLHVTIDPVVDNDGIIQKK